MSKMWFITWWYQIRQCILVPAWSLKVMYRYTCSTKSILVIATDPPCVQFNKCFFLRCWLGSFFGLSSCLQLDHLFIAEQSSLPPRDITVTKQVFSKCSHLGMVMVVLQRNMYQACSYIGGPAGPGKCLNHVLMIWIMESSSARKARRRE